METGWVASSLSAPVIQPSRVGSSCGLAGRRQSLIRLAVKKHFPVNSQIGTDETGLEIKAQRTLVALINLFEIRTPGFGFDPFGGGPSSRVF